YLAEKAGIPAGVLNVVTTLQPELLGAELTGNPVVRKLSFTGSTAVGKLLSRQCADTVKKVSLELGGNAPFIVFDDADLEAAVEGAVAAKFRNGGQTCVCANRMYVQDALYDRFLTLFTERTQQLQLGDGQDPTTDIGPLIDGAAVQKVERLLEDAVQQGAVIQTGGGRHALGGTYFTPTVLSGATASMAVSREEIFGPVAPVFRFHTEEEVVQLANDTPYGLAAYFYGRDYARIWRVAEALEYGMVGINTGLISTAAAPFGGIKESGIGREGSRHGLDEYLEWKYICFGGVE
ncbi:MAG: aldehyde dehydrogenase family protein, partial [Bacteroidota bacterium]